MRLFLMSMPTPAAWANLWGQWQATFGEVVHGMDFLSLAGHQGIAHHADTRLFCQDGAPLDRLRSQ